MLALSLVRALCAKHPTRNALAAERARLGEGCARYWAAPPGRRARLRTVPESLLRDHREVLDAVAALQNAHGIQAAAALLERTAHGLQQVVRIIFQRTRGPG